LWGGWHRRSTGRSGTPPALEEIARALQLLAVTVDTLDQLTPTVDATTTTCACSPAEATDLAQIIGALRKAVDQCAHTLEQLQSQHTTAMNDAHQAAIEISARNDLPITRR
jgi:ABC-type transporter Mla subunit MlaD